jgi:uncharacterized protein YdaU (DUF1376 family)
VSPRRLPALTRQVFLLTPIQQRGDRLNYYRRFPGDYLRDTMHLSAAEDGMYGRLLDAGYTSERPLPLDRTILYAMVRANSASDRKAVESILSQYFYETKRGFRHRRIDAEITRAKAKSDAYRVSGRKGGLKRQAIAKGLLGEQSSENQASQTLDSRLHTLDSRLKAEEDTAAKAAAAFQSIGFEHPFGHANFQAIWLDEYLNPKGRWVTQQMESAIQRCQKDRIGIPPQFYEAKRDVEARENATLKTRAPL